MCSADYHDFPIILLISSSTSGTHEFHRNQSRHTFGIVKPNTPVPLISKDENGMDNTDDFFAINNQQLVMPSMLTLNEAVIRPDCLCYLMERMEPPINN